jgi:TP901 family phage tail tape measure protein
MAIIIPIVSAWNPAGLNKALADIKRAKTGMDKFAAGAQGIGTQMTQIGTNLSTKVSLPLALIGASAVKVASEFEVSMAQVAVATDMPISGLKNLSDLAKQLGADTIFSANEASNAMLELAKAGLSPAEIEAGALENTLNLAAASGMALAESAIVMAAGMNTFNLGASDSVNIVDALAGAANASAADVADIAMALQQTGQQAVASGLTIQETTAALAAFADAGVRGSDAGTSFKTFLQRLNPVSAEASRTMKQLGIEFFDSAGNMKDLSGIADEVQKGFTGLTQEQRLAAMQTIFGSDALRAANILFDEGATGIQQYIDATNKSGAAQDMASARMSGTAGALEAMKGSIETASLALGEALAPVVLSVAGFVQDLANKFAALDPKVQTAIASVGIFLVALGPMLMITGSLLTAAGKIAAVFSTISTAVAKAGGAMAIATGPIAIFVAALAGAILIVVALWRESEIFRNAVTNAFNRVKSAIVDAVNLIKTKLGENSVSLDNLKAAFKAVGDFIGRYIIPILSVVLTNAINIVARYIGFLIDAIGFVMRAFNAFIDVVRNVVTFIGNLVTRFNDAANAGEGFSGRVARAIQTLLSPIINLFNWINNVTKALGGTATAAVGFIDASAIAATRADDKLMKVDKTTLQLGKDSIKTSTDIKALGVQLSDVAGKGTKAAKANDTIKNSLQALNEEFKKQKGVLQSALDAYDNFKNGIKTTITGILNFGSAQQSSFDSIKAAADAQVALTAAQKQYDDSLKTDNIEAQQTALENLQAAQTSAANSVTNKKSFLQILQEQADLASTFSGKVQTLIAMGLSESAIGQVLASGATAGSAIADEIIAGGATVVDKVNGLVVATDSVATQLAEAMPAEFFKAGVTAGQALVDGVRSAIAAAGFVVNAEGTVVNQAGIDAVAKAVRKAKNKKSEGGTKISKKERQSIEELAASLGVDIPKMAKGGIVTGPTLALIGEAGPEAVVPLTGNNMPMGATYNINVTAGMGADGAVIGREIVDAIKKYERASGPVFASA